jgi:hypothetical protein
MAKTATGIGRSRNVFPVQTNMRFRKSGTCTSTIACGFFSLALLFSVAVHVRILETAVTSGELAVNQEEMVGALVRR